MLSLLVCSFAEKFDCYVSYSLFMFELNSIYPQSKKSDFYQYFVLMASQSTYDHQIVQQNQDNQSNIKHLSLTQKDFSISKFKQMYNPKITHLILNCNLNLRIIKQIELNLEQNLVFLNLGQNGIKSIEPLTNVAFPNLQQLHLFRNSIFELKCLRRIFAPKLRYISLVQNKIRQLNQIQQGNFLSLEQLWIYDNFILNPDSLFKSKIPILYAMSLGDLDDHKKYRIMLQQRFKIEL